MADVEFADLKGKILASVVVDEGMGEIVFTTVGGEKYLLSHYQDCCEDVYIEDICGDIDDMLESIILIAEEVVSEDAPEGATTSYDSATWTFYKLETKKGGVTIRWCGESNGYYSESVDFTQVNQGLEEL